MMYYGYINEYENWEVFNSKEILKEKIKKLYGKNINFAKFLFEYDGILFTTNGKKFKFYGFSKILEKNNFLIRKIYKKLSDNFSYNEKNIVLVEFKKTLGEKTIHKLSYEQLEKTGKKTPLKVFDKIDTENFRFSYGGFITGKNEIIKVDEFSHLKVLEDYFNIESYNEAYKNNFVRFITKMFPEEFVMSGKKNRLLETFKKWSDFALQNKILRFNIISNGLSTNVVIENEDLSEKKLYNLIKYHTTEDSTARPLQ